MHDDDLEFLRTRLSAAYGADGAQRIERGLSARRPVTLRANTLKASAAEVQAELEDAGIGCSRVPWYEDALVVQDSREPRLQETDAYKNGRLYLQSLSSMLPPLVLSPAPGENILDMAAAPGGKTTQTAALSGNGALITACEKNPIRADRLRFNLERQGAARVNVMQVDARRLDTFFSFDKILLDAPCSGSGTLNLEDDESFSQELVERSVRAQAALLDRALHVLKPGGTLVYSTCSVLKEENEELVSRALEGTLAKAAARPGDERPGKGRKQRGRRRGGRGAQISERPLPPVEAELVPVEGAFLEHLPMLPSTLDGALTVCPDDLFEGFFVAVLKRVR